MANDLMKPIVVPTTDVYPNRGKFVYDPKRAEARKEEMITKIKRDKGIPDNEDADIRFPSELEKGLVRVPEKDIVEISGKSVYNPEKAAAKRAEQAKFANLPFIQSAHIGVHPDGSPVVYDPEKAAAKRAEIIAQIREKEGIPEGGFLTVSFAPELEKGYVRSPEKDTEEIGENFPEMVVPNYNQELKALKIPPKVKDAATDMLVEIIKRYGVEVAVFLITTGWNAIFGGNNNEESAEEPLSNNLRSSFEAFA